MTRLAGNYLQAYLDDYSGVLRAIEPGDLRQVQVGLTYKQHDATNFGDAVKKFINGQMQAPLTLSGYVTAGQWGTHRLLNQAYLAQTTVTLRVYVGQNATPTVGDPVYSGEFLVAGYQLTLENGSAIRFDATLKLATGTAPTWAEAGSTSLYDTFTTDDAAPLAAPRTAEPGPGTWTVTDTGNLLSISSEQLHCAAGGSWGDPQLYMGTSRQAGLGMMYVVERASSAAFSMGFTDYVPSNQNNCIAALEITTGGDVWARLDGGALADTGVNISNNEIYKHAVILRSQGEFFVDFSNGLAKLIWVEDDYTTSSLYASLLFNSVGSTASSDAVRLAQLGAPFDQANALEIFNVASPVVGERHATKSADFFMRYTVDSLPTTTNDSLGINIRQQDGSNNWRLVIKKVATNYDIYLEELVSGSPTVRATSNQSMSGGEDITVIADGSSISAYKNNALLWTYSSATNFQTETTAELGWLNTGAAISDWICYPRYLSQHVVGLLEGAVQ